MTQRDNRIVELAHAVKALAASQEHERRRRLWTESMALRTTRPPVNFYMYQDVWAAELAGDAIKSTEPLAREVETQLAFKLWRAEHLADDFPVQAAIKVEVVRPKRTEPFPWGVEMPVERTDEAGAYKEVPALKSYEDIERIKLPRYEVDAAATERVVGEIEKLVDGALPVNVTTSEMHWGPFEYAVRLRGIEPLLFDVYDAPEFVHRLMGVITDGIVAYQKEREAAGGVTPEQSAFGHVPYAEAPRGMERKLKGMWAYIHAQSAASLSPAMYEEFIHPYDCRVAELVGLTYYHGCEDLSKKARVIRTLPGLRLFHVSPWTPAAPVIAELGTSVAYEVHSHPTNVLFGEGREVIRAELERMQAGARGTAHVLTLADVETFAGKWERVAYWAEAAQELAAKG